MATKKRKRTARKPVRRTRRANRTISKRKAPRRRKKAVRRKLNTNINTCSGSGYYLRKSKKGWILTKAGKGLRCLCKSKKRPGCRSKKRK